MAESSYNSFLSLYLTLMLRFRVYFVEFFTVFSFALNGLHKIVYYQNITSIEKKCIHNNGMDKNDRNDTIDLTEAAHKEY